MISKLLLALPLILITCGIFAQHTFSICAVDTVTGEVGSAGASCIGNSVIISDIHPGVGVIHTQAAYNSANQNLGRALMNAGYLPDKIIDSLINGDFVLGAPNRQYGVVGIYNGSPLADAYTGADCIDYKNHIIGAYYTIQGNILLGQEILDSMETWFLNTEGNLACRLMAALQGAKVTGADTRCLSSGNSSLSSFLRVAQPGDDASSPSVNLIVNSGPPGYEPIDSLQELFDRLQLCAAPTGTGISEMEPFGYMLFPNPAERKIFIIGQLLSDSWIELYDRAGEKKFSAKITSREINTENLPGDFFLWKIVSDGRILKTGKIILR
ncbi:MAG TPA: DUF1028 domain-containing protein [Chitinophagales bacterium]|nr:DUF1028 domain-containing protein [Chitinophagales bacterium]